MRIVYLLVMFLFTIKSYCQVNLAGGSAEFNLPVFSWQDNKSRLSTGVSVTYSSGSGLKVNSVASNIGQGWNVIQGGVITRITAGEPDDQQPYEGNGTPEDIRKYPAGYFYGNTTEPGYSNHLTKYPIFKDKNHVYKQHNVIAADKQMDQFNFLFNGRSGTFVLGKGLQSSITPKLLNDVKLKVWFDLDESQLQQGIRTTISAFHIQDEQGIIYHFSRKELTKVLKTIYTDRNGVANLKQPNFKAGNVYYESSVDGDANEMYRPFIVTAWHLTSIEDPLTGREIHFNYQSSDIDADAGISLTYNSNKDYSMVSQLISMTNTPQIKEILLPDAYKIEFIYGEPRIDLSGDKVLKSIDIKYKERYVNRYNFHTKYVIKNRYGTPQTDYQKKSARLFLTSITKSGPDLKGDEKPYLFDYYLGSGNLDDFVPPPFYALKDIWGYYNGDNSRSFSGNYINADKSVFDLNNQEVKGLCFLRQGVPSPVINPKDGLARNGLLQRIMYPAGNSLTYEYEQNKAMLSGQVTSVGGVHVSKVTITDGGYSNDCNNPAITVYNYTLEDGVQSSLWDFEMPVNLLTYKTYYEADGKKYKFPTGVKYNYFYPGILSRDNTVSLTGAQRFWGSLFNMVGIASSVLQVLDVIKYAAGITGPGMVIIDAITTAVGFLISWFTTPSDSETVQIYYNVDLNGSNPLPHLFKRVEVTEGNGSTGKTVYEFTSDDDYPVWSNTNPTFALKQRFAPWAYGLNKRTAIYDSDGNILEETINTYDNSLAKKLVTGCPGIYPQRPVAPLEPEACIDHSYTSYNNLILKSSSQRSDDWTNPSVYENEAYTSDLYSNPDMMVDQYDFYKGRSLLTKSVHRKYVKGYPLRYSQTIIEYSYNDADCNYCGESNYEVKEIKTTQADGDIQYQTFRYIDPMLYGNNIINTPYESTTSFMKAGDTIRYYTGESVTRFDYSPNGNVVPVKIVAQRFSVPQPGSAMHFYITADDPYSGYVIEREFFYDDYGNAFGQREEGGRTVKNIYDHEDRFAVATVTGADPVNDKTSYSSFETDDFSRSGWAVSGSKVYSNAAVTGYRSLTLASGNTLTAQLNTAKPYTLSFWATSGLSVSGSPALVKSSPAINGFTYYEYKVAAGVANIGITGSGNIDELRLYPVSARMNSTAYDPVLGKIAECDQNNRITYYEYDALGRLRFIEDEHRDVVKMYEYNEKSAYQSCPNLFKNPEISEVFVKNNCGPGFAGSEVVYTIPAGKYSSAISREEVDFLVEKELAELGQAYANAQGTCKQVFTNDAMSESFTKEGCDAGYKGTTITYTVPAGKYTSTVSKADANRQAQEETDANGQAYANATGNASCVVDYDPQFVGEEDAPSQCQSINGTYTGNRLILVKDINPNSPSYNQTQWVSVGRDPSCPSSNCTFSASAPFTIVAGSVGYYQNSTILFYIIFKTNINPYWTYSNKVATINGGCRPATEKMVSVSEHDRTWEVKISADGSLNVRLLSGTPPALGTPVGLTNVSYNIP